MSFNVEITSTRDWKGGLRLLAGANYSDKSAMSVKSFTNCCKISSTLAYNTYSLFIGSHREDLL